ncbi:MAG TPA: four helix bundle protein [Tepidisphaeraceae bacterium]
MKNENFKFKIGQTSTLTAEQLADRLLTFGARVGTLVDALPDTRLGRHIAGQLVRSGTSPAPNYEEGRAAESRQDFIHKLNICLKELRESHVWLRLILKAKLLREQRLSKLIDECRQLSNILGKSVVTAKRNKLKDRRSVSPPSST